MPRPFNKKLQKEINYVLEANWIHKGINELTPSDWEKVSSCKKSHLSEDFIRTFNQNLDLHQVSLRNNLSMHIITDYFNRFDITCLVRHQYLNRAFIENHLSKISLHELCIYQTLAPDFIDEYADTLPWVELSQYQSLPEWLIEKHIDRVYWYHITRSQSLSKEFIAKHLEKLDIDLVKEYQNVPSEISDSFQEKLMIKFLESIHQNAYDGKLSDQKIKELAKKFPSVNNLNEHKNIEFNLMMKNVLENLKNEKGQEVTPQVYFNYLNFEKLEELAFSKDQDEALARITAPIKEYLKSLPNYLEPEIFKKSDDVDVDVDVDTVAKKSHRYFTMKTSAILKYIMDPESKIEPLNKTFNVFSI